MACLVSAAPNYDLINDDGTHVKGNGYRSLLQVFMALLDQLVTHLQKSARDRGGLLYTPAKDLSILTADTRALQVMAGVHKSSNLDCCRQ